MYWKEPSVVTMSHGTAAVLRALAGAEGSFGIREIARIVGLSPNRVSQAVTRLTEHGVVITDSSAGSRGVRLNRDHIATEPLLTLANLRALAIARIRAEISSWPIRPIHAALFGSAARGDGTTASDIDLLVVHQQFTSPAAQTEWDNQLAGSTDAIHRWTGNWVGWFQVTSDALQQMIADHEVIVDEWRRDAITLFGPATVSILRAAS